MPKAGGFMPARPQREQAAEVAGRRHQIPLAPHLRAPAELTAAKSHRLLDLRERPLALRLALRIAAPVDKSRLIPTPPGAQWEQAREWLCLSGRRVVCGPAVRCLAALALTAGSLALGCGAPPKAVRAYAGAPRPANEVAVVRPSPGYLNVAAGRVAGIPLSLGSWDWQETPGIALVP